MGGKGRAELNAPRSVALWHHPLPVRRPPADGAANAADKQVTVLKYKVAGVNGGREAGGSVFDISGFKPVQSIDPMGNETTCVYDELHRVIEKTGTLKKAA